MMIDGQLMKKKNVVCKDLNPTDETTYWRKMAEEYRTKLDEVTRENEQV